MDKLDEYQAIVGGLIEFTTLATAGAAIVSNEEGLLIGLPVNAHATQFLYDNAPEHRGYTVLVGDCLVVGLPDRKGYTTSVPDKVLAVFGLE